MGKMQIEAIDLDLFYLQMKPIWRKNTEQHGNATISGKHWLRSLEPPSSFRVDCWWVCINQVLLVWSGGLSCSAGSNSVATWLQPGYRLLMTVIDSRVIIIKYHIKSYNRSLIYH